MSRHCQPDLIIFRPILACISIYMSIRYHLPLSLLVHRLSTMVHYLARAPFKRKGRMRSNWAWQDTDLPPQVSKVAEDDY